MPILKQSFSVKPVNLIKETIIMSSAICITVHLLYFHLFCSIQILLLLSHSFAFFLFYCPMIILAAVFQCRATLLVHDTFSPSSGSSRQVQQSRPHNRYCLEECSLGSVIASVVLLTIFTSFSTLFSPRSYAHGSALLYRASSARFTKADTLSHKAHFGRKSYLLPSNALLQQK